MEGKGNVQTGPKKNKKQPQRQHIGQARPWATAYGYFRHLSIKFSHSIFFLF